MKKPLLFVAAFVMLLTTQAHPERLRDLSDLVNPFIGTGGHGHTFPGATVPFGMVQLSPDTRIDNWDGSSGYHYSDSNIYGFSHTHLSGTGIPDYCDVLFMPMMGRPLFTASEGDRDTNGYASKFSHSNETASPGYYKVLLEDDEILAEMTATARAGIHRYTFPKDGETNILLDLKWRDEVLDSSLKVVGPNRVEGHRRSRSWAKDQVIYFVAEFSKPFKGAAGPDGRATEVGTTIEKSKDIRTAFAFDVRGGEQILLKVGISAVDLEGARRNLSSEISDWDFNRVHEAARSKWNDELSQFEISGGTEEERVNFYTALYHTKIQPNLFQDQDGRYRGLDGKVHSATPNSNYTVFSLWDTFRSAHPLYTITERKRTVDFINTFIRMYEQGGRLPVWELAGNETDTMIGYHAVPVIADAMAKGIEGFDYRKALEAAVHSAELDHLGLEAYKRRGYISMEDEQESVSKTLEYAYDDACIAVMAGIVLTKDPLDERVQKIRDRYIWRSRYYRNLFDKNTGFMRPKQNGNWVSPFTPGEVTFHFTEGNSWVYSFFAPHDISGLIRLHGGKEAFSRKLEELFTTEEKLSGREQPDITGLIGQYAHGNEPSHHIAYLFNYSDMPWKTQALVRRIMDDFYHPRPDGLIGNEDCGQMSAWYVLSALGIFQVNPGEPRYTLGSPLFDKATIRLENGKAFTVRVNRPSKDARYIAAVSLNERRLSYPFIDHDAIANGGELVFTMSETPVPDAFQPYPLSPETTKLPDVPTIEGQRVFEGKTVVSISTPDSGFEIRYTTDGSLPGEASKLYSGPFEVTETTRVRAVAMVGNVAGIPAEALLNRMPHDWDLTIASTVNRQYTGGGPKGLIDGIRGTTNFASGEWQGYQGQDLVGIIDLRRPTEINSVGAGLLQVARSWIWMPSKMTFESSSDGVIFTPLAEIKTDLDPREMTPTIRDYRVKVSSIKTRYIRLHIYNFGKIPSWHPGAGFDAFIFIDEVFLN